MPAAETTGVEPAEVVPSPQQVRHELQLILKSEQFARADKQSALLAYLCQKYLEGKSGELKESVLAVEVFHRDSGYSASEDSLVRVQIHELRRRLREYYAGTGSGRPLRIEIPRGSYGPRFTRMESVVAIPVAPPAKPQLHKWILYALSAIAAASLGVNLWAVLSARTAAAQRTELVPNEDDSAYRELFAANAKPRETLLCLSNPQVLLVDGAQSPLPSTFVTKQTIPLGPEVKQSLRPQLPYVYLHPTSDEYTGMGEAASAYELGRLMQRLSLTARLTQARFLNWDRAREDNVVILGMPFSNEWTDRNFPSRLFQNTDKGLKLTLAADGDDAAYPTSYDPTTGRVLSDYGVISRERNASGASVLILAGRSSFATYGVGDFFCDSHRMNPIFQKLRASGKSGMLPRDFVILVKIQVSEDIPIGVSFVKLQSD